MAWRGVSSDPGDEFAERHPPVTAALDRTTFAGSPPVEQPLAPVTATLRAMFGTSTELPGLAPDLLVHDSAGWLPPADLTRHSPATLPASGPGRGGWAPAPRPPRPQPRHAARLRPRALAGPAARRGRAGLEGLHLLAGA